MLTLQPCMDRGVAMQQKGCKQRDRAKPRCRKGCNKSGMLPSRMERLIGRDRAKKQ
jgi:hypothetical protein